MIQINASEALTLFSQVAAEHTKSMKLSILEDAVHSQGIRFLLNVYAKGVLRPPLKVFNKIPTTDVFTEIAQYFDGNLTKVSRATLQIIRYISTNGLGVTRGDVYDLLIKNQAVCDVHAYLDTTSSSNGCLLCGAGTLNGELCDYCYNQIEEFTNYRSDNTFSTRLTEDNYGRVPLLRKTQFTVNLPIYTVEYDGHLTFTRTATMYQAELPIKEYQKTLVN